jgi:hypothetical protein
MRLLLHDVEMWLKDARWSCAPKFILHTTILELTGNTVENHETLCQNVLTFEQGMFGHSVEHHHSTPDIQIVEEERREGARGCVTSSLSTLHNHSWLGWAIGVRFQAQYDFYISGLFPSESNAVISLKLGRTTPKSKQVYPELRPDWQLNKEACALCLTITELI